MKINIENKEKICKAISDAEGKSYARCIGYSDIKNAVAVVEQKLSIPKNALLGVTIYADPNAQTFPQAYKYLPMSTQVTIKRFPSGWFLIGIRRKECKRHRYTLDLPEYTKQSILYKYTADFD